MKERMNKLKELVTKSKKNLIIAIGCITLVIALAGGCILYAMGNAGAEKAVAAEEAEKRDISDIVAGVEDHYILENSQNINYLYGVTYDDSIVKEVTVDSSNVDLSTPGEYAVTYTIKTDRKALEEYLGEKIDTEDSTGYNTEDQESEFKSDSKEESSDKVSDKGSDSGKDESGDDQGTDIRKTEDKDSEKKDETADSKKDETTSDKKSDSEKADSKSDNSSKNTESEGKSDSKDTIDIDVDTTITVVDKDTAGDLANKGETVWKDNNETVPKLDGSEAEDKTETSAGEKKDENTGTSAKEDQKTDSKKDESKKDNNKTEVSKPSTGDNTSKKDNNKTEVSRPSTGDNTSKKDNTSSSGSSSAKPSKPAHEHNWVTVKATGHYEDQIITAAWDEDVYETRCVFPDGATFSDPDDAVDYSVIKGMNYDVRDVKVNTIHHPAVTKPVWVQDTAAYTYCTGCNAKK